MKVLLDPRTCLQQEQDLDDAQAETVWLDELDPRLIRVGSYISDRISATPRRTMSTPMAARKR